VPEGWLRENVEAVRRAIVATYRGHECVRRYLGSMEQEFKDLRIEPVT
jgi:hypothetical protein